VRNQCEKVAADGGYTFLRNVGSHKILQGATSQKTAFFIVTAVKISNLMHKEKVRSSGI
jgi:hypothetical protein